MLLLPDVDHCGAGQWVLVCSLFAEYKLRTLTSPMLLMRGVLT